MNCAYIFSAILVFFVIGCHLDSSIAATHDEDPKEDQKLYAFDGQVQHPKFRIKRRVVYPSAQVYRPVVTYPNYQGQYSGPSARGNLGRLGAAGDLYASWPWVEGTQSGVTGNLYASWPKVERTRTVLIQFQFSKNWN